MFTYTSKYCLQTSRKHLSEIVPPLSGIHSKQTVQLWLRHYDRHIPTSLAIPVDSHNFCQCNNDFRYTKDTCISTSYKVFLKGTCEFPLHAAILKSARDFKQPMTTTVTSNPEVEGLHCCLLASSKRFDADHSFISTISPLPEWQQ